MADQPSGAKRHSIRWALWKLDRGLLHTCEFFFGLRSTWRWWQRRLEKLR